jgi:hypothetical protein
MSAPKQYLSFRDFIPPLKMTKKNFVTIGVTTYVKNRLNTYKEKNQLNSFPHAINSLLIENEMLRSIMTKLDLAIKKAKIENNVDFFIVAFEDLASNKERAMFDLIWRGALY